MKWLWMSGGNVVALNSIVCEHTHGLLKITTCSPSNIDQ